MEYLKRYLEFVLAKRPDFGSLKIGIDCSNGMSSLLVHDVFPNAVIINDIPNGNFPCHSPNPLKEEAREQIAALVREQHLDCGVIFDGDADRAMMVDECGKFIQPDYLIPIVAEATLKAMNLTAPDNRVVLHDVRTSRGSIETLVERGFKPVMVPVGHAFAKPKMRELNALCGGELAGHYYFGDFFGCDSGILAAMRVLGELQSSGQSFSAMMSPIMSRYANSGEVNFRVEAKDAAIQQVLELIAKDWSAREIGRSELDGVRLEFDEGWVNIRKSNTEPYLRLIVEAKTKALLDDWVSKIGSVIKSCS